MLFRAELLIIDATNARRMGKPNENFDYRSNNEISEMLATILAADYTVQQAYSGTEGLLLFQSKMLST